MFGDLLALLDAIKARDVRAAWAAVVKLGDALFGPHPHPIGSEAASDAVALRECCDQIEAACKEGLSAGGAAAEAPAVGGAGWAVLFQIALAVVQALRNFWPSK